MVRYCVAVSAGNGLVGFRVAIEEVNGSDATSESGIETAWLDSGPGLLDLLSVSGLATGFVSFIGPKSSSPKSIRSSVACCLPAAFADSTGLGSVWAWSSSGGSVSALDPADSALVTAAAAEAC